MTRTGRMILVVACGVLCLVAPLAAHHSANTKYDLSRPITLKGKVTKVEWMNPHIYFYIDAADPSGKTANWALEGGPPNQLYRRGWKRDSLNLGDVVTVEGYQARQPGLHHVNVRTVILPDGRKVFSGSNDGLPEQLGTPAARGY